MTEASVTKSDFATLCSVDKSRVSQWIRDKKIDGAALVGQGRSARIVPSIAREQLKSRLDISQRFGMNGIKTKLVEPKPASPAPAVAEADYLLEILAEAPSAAAEGLAGHGLSAAARYAAFHWVRAAIVARLGWGEGPFTLPDFEQADWAEIAAESGEPVDLVGWEKDARRIAYGDDA